MYSFLFLVNDMNRYDLLKRGNRMKKSYIIIFFCVIFLIISMGIGYYIYKLIPSDKKETKEIALEKIEDECTEEMKSLKIENEVIASSVEEKKVSPNATLVIKKYYKKCGHTTKDYAEIPPEIVNKSEKEVAEYYNGWELKGFSSNEIVLYREEDGNCNEHYILREIAGRIGIYTIDDNNIEILKEKTQISTEYLTEADLNKLKEGIKIIGKEELNATIENFE